MAEEDIRHVDENDGGDNAEIRDTDIVFDAVRTEDFEIDGNVSKAVWKKARPIKARS